VGGGGTGTGGRGRIVSKAEAGNQVAEQLRQMLRAMHIPELNAGQVWNQLHPPQPLLDRRINFAVQQGRYTQYCFQFLSPLKG
jgi:hypothetical protein